ncbi:DMT family transporter [Rheinheimera sp.]|uniref:DMT family transporter n=1 Tax=Rheinheimera sp. TaxID=1869214 RepID=UPI003D26C287
MSEQVLPRTTVVTKPSSVLTEAYAYGLAGVLMFSGGIVATRMAVLELPPVFVGAGRAAVAGLLSLLLLWAMQQKVPARRFWPGLFIVAFGAAFAFPVFTALALQWTDAGYATLVTTLMPLFTAIFGAWFSRQVPRIGFWLFACCGAALVLGYSLTHHQVSALALGDGLLLLACLFCGLAYAKGAMLAKDLGSWQVICWALVLALPVLLPWTLWQIPAIEIGTVSVSAWLGFAYLSVFSMFLGFFAWYRGLSLGGVAQISQLQQLSPFLGLGWAALCLGEHISGVQLIIAALVMICIVLGRRFG